MKSAFRNVLFALILSAGALLLLEGASRCYFYFWGPATREGTYLSEKKDVLAKKKDNEIRIFCYGASTVWGEPSPPLGFVAETAYFLKQHFKERDVQVHNFGMPGQPSSYVLDKLRRTIRNAPDLLIILTGHNEMLNPSTAPQELLIRFRGRSFFFRLLHNALTFLVVKNELIKWSKKYSRPETAALIEKKTGLYRQNLQQMIDLSQDYGVPLILCTVPYNKLWPPVSDGQDGLFWEEVGKVWNRLEKGELAAAGELIENKLAQNPVNPVYDYLSGRLHYEEGDYGEAARFYRKAKENDEQRIRVLDIFNSVIRLSSMRRGVYLVDGEEAFDRNSPHGISGYELFADNCHPSLEGNFLITQLVLAAIKKNNLLKDRRIPVPTRDDLTVYLKDIHYDNPPGEIRKPYFLSVATYHLDREPLLFNSLKARQFLEQARREYPDDWVIVAYLAGCSYRRGELERARMELQEAEQLKGGLLKLEDVENIPYLEALYKMSR